MALRVANDEVNDNYVYFCENFVKTVVGAQRYKRGWKNNLDFSEIATPSDEALTLLLLENSMYRWTTDDEEKGPAPPRYTSAGKNKEQKGVTKKYGGWTKGGIERFNDIVRKVREDRKVNGRRFDNYMKEAKSAEEDFGTGVKVTANCIRAENDLVFSASDDDDDEGSKDDEEDLVQQVYQA